MGTPDFAVTILDGLLYNNINVVGVITAPDKPAGRGQKIHKSAVKKYAEEKQLKILQPTNLKNESFLEDLKNLNANLQIIVAFRMLPKVVWSMPALGTFNLHASLLPNYRGAAPINWAIINGEEKTGVTTFFIDDKIDTGEIILQSETPIKSDETVGELHDRLMHLGSELVVKTAELISKGSITTVKQPDTDDKFAPKLFPENCKINWNDTTDNIHNKVRGLNPYPAAWSTLENDGNEIHVKLYNVRKEQLEHKLVPGSLNISKNSLKVACKDGFLIIDTLKLAGKRKMDAKSLLNGFQFSAEAKML